MRSAEGLMAGLIFISSRSRHTRYWRDWSSDVCSSDLPEVLELSGAKLREVGTTNRTRLSDYERAINENTRAILWVHPSNFEVRGFTESVGVAELATLSPPVVADVGSGALLPFGDEPLVGDVVGDGAALT